MTADTDGGTSNREKKKDDHSILECLPEEQNPEVRLRTLKEYERLPEDDNRVIDCKKRPLQSKVYERGLKKL